MSLIDRSTGGPGGSEGVLEVSGLDARYGDLQVLWDVNLAVGRGEIVSVLGANGAGKSTLLRSIIGLHRGSSGRVRFQGRPLEGEPPDRRVLAGLGLVPEERGIFPAMTVLDNLYMGLYATAGRDRARRELDWIYDLFPVLRERSQQVAGSLSGGQQQMLAVARALLPRPRLLMFDEPSLGLAPVLVARLFATIDRINDMGISILLVEQNARQSLRLSDRAYVLENGRIVREGAAAALLDSDEIRRAYLGI